MTSSCAFCPISDLYGDFLALFGVFWVFDFWCFVDFLLVGEDSDGLVGEGEVEEFEIEGYS